MLNDEVGTYQIIAALDADLTAPMRIVSDNKVEMILNGVKRIGNLKIIKSIFNEVNLVEEPTPVELTREMDLYEILDEEYGISVESDWLNVMEKKEDIISEAMKLVTKVDDTEEVKESKFKFESNINENEF